MKIRRRSACLSFVGTIVLFLIAHFTSGPVSYAQRLPGPLFDSRAHVTSSALEERLAIHAEALQSLLASAGNTSIAEFPIAPGERGHVEMRRVRPVIDENTRIIAGTANGDKALATPAVDCFRGVIPGENNSRVFMAASGDMVFCTITRGDGRRYILAPASSGDNELVLVNEQHVKQGEYPPQFSCAPLDPVASKFSQSAAPGSFRAPATLLQLEIAVEADYPYFRATGKDTSKTIAYTAALFSMVSVLYEDEINVTIHLPWLKIWTDSIADPYKVNGNAYALWDTVPRYWQAHYADVPRHLAHVLTSIDYGGGGIASLGTKFEGGSEAICSQAYGYGMSSPTGLRTFPTFAFTYDVYIVAHELGHNFGARHTHTCWWNPAIDTCFTRDDAQFALADACYAKPITPRISPGSIMSYCASTSYGMSGDFNKYKLEMTFLPQVAAVMRSEAAAATCLQEPAVPTVILKSPRGDRELRTDMDVEITWASARVERVALEYSLDNGPWNSIAANIAATEGRHIWHTPVESADRARVRIVDATRPDVADTSIIAFAIVAGTDSRMPASGDAPTLAVTASENGIRVDCGTGSRAARIAITLHDMNGRELRSIAFEQEAAAGMRTFTIPAGELPSGIYLVTADAGGKRVSRPITITR